MDGFTLDSAAQLLDDQAKIFSDVYKLYGFRGEQSLSEYVEFFLHEPVAWFEGLPGTLKSKASFAKPKTAFSKLMKKADVIAALGEDVCHQTHEVLWDTYKKEADRIVAARSRGDELVLEVHEILEEEPAPPATTNEATTATTANTATTIKATKARRSRKQEPVVHNTVATVAATVAAAVAANAVASSMTYESKYRVIDRAFRAFLNDGTPGSEGMLVFLDALKDL
jgi:hypothetical protein